VQTNNTLPPPCPPPHLPRHTAGRPSAPRTKRSVRVGASRAQSTAAARRRARLEVAIDTLLAERTQRSSALLASLCWQHGCCGQREIDIYSEVGWGPRCG